MEPPKFEHISTPSAFTLEWFKSVYIALNNGELSIEDYKTSFNYIRDNKDKIIEFLTPFTKDKLLSMVGSMTGYRLKSEKKDVIVKGVYDTLLDEFVLGSYSYGFVDSKLDVISKKINSATQADLEKFAKEVAVAREERKIMLEKYKKAFENPETLEEFKIFIEKKGESALNLEQKKLYDSLVSEKVLIKREIDLKTESEIKKVDGLDTELKIIETAHTKTNQPLFVVQLNDRVEKEVYNELNKKAKQLGGYYSSFRGSGAVPGFQFKTKDQAEKFISLRDGNVSDFDRKEEIQENKIEKRAEKLRSTANSIIEKANETLNAERLTNTYKRAQQANSTESKARSDKQLAQTMINVADAIDNNEAKYLDNISAKTHIELLDLIIRRAKIRELNKKYPNSHDRASHEGEPPTDETLEYADTAYYPNIYASHIKDLIKKSENRAGGKLVAKRWEKKIAKFGEHENYQLKSDEEVDELEKMYNSLYIGDKKYNRVAEYLLDFKRMKAMKIENPSMLREVLREYIKFRGGKQEVDKVKQLERQLAGRSNVGVDFFPTPKSLAERMVEMADIQPGMTVLEPSAGNGNIADTIKETGTTPDVIELSSTLREILEAKGYNVVANDFIEFNDKKYDRIIMNPPFSDGMDAEHIIHAYNLLNQGGRIVAIAGEGIFTRSDKKAKEFQYFLTEHEVESEKLEANTFMDKKLYSTTGANARLIVINKNEQSIIIPITQVEQSLESKEIKEPQMNTETTSHADLQSAYDNFKIYLTEYQSERPSEEIIYDIAKSLLKQMFYTASGQEEYRTKFIDWLIKGSTLELKELLTTTNYDESNLDHFNAFTLLDSASVFIADKIAAENPTLDIIPTIEEKTARSEVEIQMEYNDLKERISGQIKADNKRLVGIMLDEAYVLVEENPILLKDYIDFVHSLPAKFKVIINPYDRDFHSEKIVNYLQENNINLFELFPVKKYTLPKYKPFETNHNNKVFMDIHAIASGGDDLRPALLGSYFEERGVVSTNAHVMLFTVYKGKSDDTNKIYCHTSKCFKASEGKEEIDGRFPNWSAVIPRYNPHKILLNEKAIYNFLSNSLAFKLPSVVTNKIILTTKIEENGEEVNYQIAFNAELFRQSIEAMLKLGHQELEISFSAPNRAAVIYPKGKSNTTENFDADFMLVMPIMMGNGGQYDKPATEEYNLDTNCMNFIDAETEVANTALYCFDIDMIEKKEIETKINETQNQLTESKNKIAQLETEKEAEKARNLLEKQEKEKRLADKKKKNLELKEKLEAQKAIDELEARKVSIKDKLKDFYKILSA